MATAMDFHKSERAYLRRKGQIDAVAHRLTHQCSEQVEEEEVRRQKLQDNPALREAINARQQVVQHETGFKERARAFLLTQGSRYKAQLVRAIQSDSRIALVRADGSSAVPISLAELQGMAIGLGDDLLHRIAPGVAG